MKNLFSRHNKQCLPTQIQKIKDFLCAIQFARPVIYNRLDSADWTAAHDIIETGIIDQIRSNAFLNEWTAEMERLTTPGDSLLEIGCALGATSLYLGRRGRNVTGLDYSKRMCDSFLTAATELEINVQAICADILRPLPVPDNAFDVVWHAGVIEHFSNDEAQFIITENARVARKCVISMAPNAASIAYRIGKEYAERTGGWLAGEEHPKYTQIDMFANAGLTNIREYTIDTEFALRFLPDGALRDVLAVIYRSLPTADDIHQGYLLVTIGDKK